MERLKTDQAKIIILVLAAMLSFFVLSRVASSPKLHSHAIESLDKKRLNITRLTAAATSASVAVSLLPDDTATPIAENLADLTDYFLIALCAVYLEKYLITMTGFATFGVLFPIAFLLIAARIKNKNPKYDYYAKKLIAFGIAIFLLIPASIILSDTIENTYQFSIDEAIERAEGLSEEIEAETEASTESEGLLDSIIDTTTSVVGDVIGTAKEWLSKGEQVLNELLESLAVLLVTSCLIPIIVLLFFLFLIQIFTNIDVPTPYPRYRIGTTRKLLKTKKTVN